MIWIFKIIISSLMIVLITEIAKKHSIIGGLVAVLPINITLSLIWLYLEKKDLALLGDFTYSALWGLFPTMFFLILVTFLFNKHSGFIPTILAGILLLMICGFIQHKILCRI